MIFGTENRILNLDTVVVLVFVAAILLLGFSARLRSNTVLQYLAAGRALSLPAFVATLVSTWYGGILGICESVSYFGIGTWVMLGVPYYVFAILYAFVFAKRVREGSQISLPERLEMRFGKGVALSGAILLFLLAVPAAHVLMLGVLVRGITGLQIVPAVLLATAVGTLFLYKGGLLADVRVSMLAFAAMYVGFGVILAWCVAKHPIWETWSSVPDKNLLKWDGGQGFLQVISFFILGAWTLVDPGFHQRVASTANPDIGRKGVLIAAVCWFVFDILSISTAMYAISIAPALAQSSNSLDRLAIFPRFGAQVLPDGLRGLFFCGMLGTIVSAMVGYALVSGATLGREIFARARGFADDAKVNLWNRIGIGIACAVAVFLALSVESVVTLWYSWGGAVVGALLLPVAAAYGLFPWLKATGGAVFASIVVAATVSLSWLAYGIRTENPLLNVNLGGAEFGLGTLVPGLAVSATVLALGHFLAIIGSKSNGGRPGTE
jgi:SSS family solute:Na+ symporter